MDSLYAFFLMVPTIFIIAMIAEGLFGEYGEMIYFGITSTILIISLSILAFSKSESLTFSEAFAIPILTLIVIMTGFFMIFAYEYLIPKILSPLISTYGLIIAYNKSLGDGLILAPILILITTIIVTIAIMFIDYAIFQSYTKATTTAQGTEGHNETLKMNDKNKSTGPVYKTVISHTEYKEVNTLLTNGKLKEAHRTTLKLQHIYPNNEMALRLLMRTSVEVNAYDLARDTAHDLLRIKSDDEEAQRVLYNISIRPSPTKITKAKTPTNKQQRERPVENIERPVESIERPVENIVNSSLSSITVHLANNHPQKAHDATMNLLERYPNNEKALRVLMRTRFQLNYWDLAEETANDLLKLNPGDKEATKALRNIRNRVAENQPETPVEQAPRVKTTFPPPSPEPTVVAHDPIDQNVETQHFNQEIDEDDLGFGDDHGYSSIKGFE